MTVSYCITLYNKEKYIERVLSAVLFDFSQTGGEIIVYDDCSTDGSSGIVRRLAEIHPIRLITGGNNLGVFAASSILIAEAKKPYLRLIDGDDVIVAGSTQYLLGLIQKYQAVFAHGIIKDATEEGSDPQQWPSSITDFSSACTGVELDAFHKFIKYFNFNLSVSLMTTAEAKKILPLPVERRIAQDVCIALRLAQQGLVVETDAVLALSPGDTGNRLSRRVAEMYRDICLIIEEELSNRKIRFGAIAAVHRNAARCLKYFRREAPNKIYFSDKAFLRLLVCGGVMFLPYTELRRCLRRMASMYARDIEKILT
jgi:glycosyltransferase involved in cell wall biosynthesis